MIFLNMGDEGDEKLGEKTGQKKLEIAYHKPVFKKSFLDGFLSSFYPGRGLNDACAVRLYFLILFGYR